MVLRGQQGQKSYPETDESGTFWISTLLDVDSRLRVTHRIGKAETEASLKVFQTLRQRGHSDGPPPLLTDGWGGIDDAMLAIYGQVPEYGGRGRPPTRPRPGEDWLYLKMVKQRDEQGRLQGIRLKAVWGKRETLVDLLGKSTAYIERSNLTTRLFNARLTRKSLAFSKDVELHEATATWDAYYNWVRPHKSLRIETHDDPQHKWTPRTPDMVANLTDHSCGCVENPRLPGGRSLCLSSPGCHPHSPAAWSGAIFKRFLTKPGAWLVSGYVRYLRAAKGFLRGNPLPFWGRDGGPSGDTNCSRFSDPRRPESLLPD